MLQIIYLISRSISSDKKQSLKLWKNLKPKLSVYLKYALAGISWRTLQVCDLMFNSRQTRINYAIKSNITKLWAIKKQ